MEESYEITPEEVAGLYKRIKELETAIANPTWFQGRHGMDGLDGRDGTPGPPGMMGDMGPPGVRGEYPTPRSHLAQDCSGNLVFTNEEGDVTTVSQSTVEFQRDLMEWQSKHTYDQLSIGPRYDKTHYEIPSYKEYRQMYSDVQRVLEHLKDELS